MNHLRTPMQRRALLALLLATPLAARAATPTLVEIWKSPTCGCCEDWMALMQAGGFSTKTYNQGNDAIRRALRMPAKLGSCHTAMVGGYAIEGHVPVREVKRLLCEKPDAVGLAVPGMPIGSAGMDGPAYQGRRDPYDVLLVLRDGSTRVYQSYR